ncbi:MAG: UbiX family flavin prenyltransferase [Deltaproteobacteria bacterium]|nr:UbiX family flavin prenyltransferase [Deltaproteobacteria bacterium]
MKRIIVGISGASGAIYGIRMMEALKGRAESHLVISMAARRTISMETSYEVPQIESMAVTVHDFNNLAAPISSGSFRTDGMVIVPCSMKSLSAVANSYGENLMARAADVTLKERRRLVLVVRETPLHIGHLRLMVRASEMGAIIFPPLPTFYNRPETLEEVLDHTIGRILDLFEIEHTLFKRWGEGKGSGK